MIGLAMLAYGITALIFGGHRFTQHAPTGAVHGETWLGLEVSANGLTKLVWGAAGASLIVLSLLPRVGGRSERAEFRPAPVVTTQRVESEPRTVQRTPVETH